MIPEPWLGVVRIAAAVAALAVAIWVGAGPFSPRERRWWD